VKAGDTRKGSEAAAHAAIPVGGAAANQSVAVGTLPVVVGGDATDRSAPRPLR
jgi:hypothetical protein